MEKGGAGDCRPAQNSRMTTAGILGPGAPPVLGTAPHGPGQPLLLSCDSISPCLRALEAGCPLVLSAPGTRPAHLPSAGSAMLPRMRLCMPYFCWARMCPAAVAVRSV